MDALYNRGVALMDLERAADALAMFEAVMPTHQNDAEMLNNRGVALWNLKRPAEALASYDRALALEPGNFIEVWGGLIAGWRCATSPAIRKHWRAWITCWRAGAWQ